MHKGSFVSFGLSVACALAWGMPARAVVVYRNINPDPTLPSEAIPNNSEIADDVTLPDGPARTVTQISIPIFNSLNQNFAGTFTARFYEFGGDGLPGAKIWEGTLPVANGTTGDRTLVFSVPNVVVPDDFVWSLQFNTNLASTEDDGIGPVLNDEPDVGFSFNEFYQRDAGGPWGAFFYGDQPTDPLANFQAEIIAEVPEPAAMSVIALGGLFMTRRRRR
jgi:hypothetical protein